jgi:TonB-dependent receptor
MKDTTDGSFNENFFPMVHLKIKPATWFDIRLAFTKTCSRPGFYNMSPRYYQTVEFAVNMGNVYLKPQTNYNYDAYLSFFTGKLGLFTVGGFYKKIEDQTVNYNVIMIDQTLYGFTNDAYRNKNYSKPINNPWPGYIQGLELDWQTQFSYLPAPFNGIILNANVTFFDSQTKYPFFETKPVYLDPAVSPYQFSEAINTYRESKVIGSSDIVGNISLGYERGGFSGRISGYYQGYTTTNQVDVTNISLDENRDDFLRIDMQLSQKIKAVEGLMVYLNLSNLTNNPDRTILTHYPERVRSEERYGASGDIGIRYKF